MTTTALTPSQLLGRNVRAEMVRRGVSQDALARRLGKSQAAVSKRLRGESPISIDEAVTIARHLDVPLSALLDGVGQ